MSELSFGAGLVSLQAAPWERPPEVYAGGLDFAREVERLGYSALWAADHHLSADGYLPSPLVYLAAAAGATERLRLGTAIAIAPLYRSPRLAEDCPSLQLLFGGRLVLGLGLGWREEERALLSVAGPPGGNPHSRRQRHAYCSHYCSQVGRNWLHQGAPDSTAWPTPEYKTGRNRTQQTPPERSLNPKVQGSSPCAGTRNR